MSLSLIDRLDILELITRVDSAASKRDADAYVSYFTDDAVLDGEKDEYRSKEALRQSVGPIWQAEGTASVHLTLNALVEPIIDDSDHAIVTSVLLILKDGPAVSVHSVSSIVQHVVKVNGSWKIERRSVGKML
jgi:ketosteroid isomerase-like protein